MMKPHKIDFHQRAVPSPMERKDKCSPRRMITMRARALTQIRASFRTAEANVVSGTKNTNTCRIATIAKSEIASPAQVARETFVGTDGCSGVTGKAAPTLSVCMISVRMRKGVVWIQEKTGRRCALRVLSVGRCCSIQLSPADDRHRDSFRRARSDAP